MILINQDTTNTVILTLTEKTTISSPTYLFEFVNDITRSAKRFIAIDISAYTDRYNEFVITETASENLYTGNIDLNEKGFYSYRIFQQASTTNLDVTLTGALVETGKVKVLGIVTTLHKYDNQPKQYVAYAG